MGSISDPYAEDARLLARVDDAMDDCRSGYTARFIGFLDERQAALVKGYTSGVRDVCCRLFGGHEEAERVMLGVFSDGFPSADDAYPFTAVAFRYRTQATITHRDVLGSLLGCGVRRDKLGDILCGDGLSVVFVQEELASYLAQNVETIGREGVTVEFPFTGTLPTFHHFQSISGTVASARLDAVVKVLLGVSREEAARRIAAALVSVNHQPVLSVSATVRAGDILSVRGTGRFVVDDVSAQTKKGRLVLQARKYC